MELNLFRRKSVLKHFFNFFLSYQTQYLVVEWTNLFQCG